MARTGAKGKTKSGVAVSILGPVALNVGGVPVPLPAKQAAALAMLALEAGRVVSIDRLIDGIWGDDAPRTVRSNLQVQVSQLRQAIAQHGSGDVIVTRAPGYMLSLEPDAVDALQFAQLVADTRRCLADGDAVEAARSANAGLQLWRGDALSGLSDAPFAAPVVTRLADQRLDLVELWADAEIACGRASSVVPPLEDWVAHWPYRETLWQRLILALYRCGRQADALARLADLRRTLRDEIGVRPCAAIVELETSILDQDGSLDAAPTAALPARLNGPGRRLPATKELTGRDELLEEALQRCLENRLVTLVGPGGIGKTSIAVNVASALTETYPDGVWFVDLSNVLDGTLVATTIGTALGMRTGDDVATLQAVVSLLADTELLLAIDNCEHVIVHAAESIERILGSCPGVRILATSRERLALPDEVAIVLPPLQSDDAVALLTRRARRGGATTTGEAAADEVALCVAVDHLPLGIELVAARLASMSARDILGQLGAKGVLQLENRTVIDRRRSLYSTVQWSYDLLSASGQKLIRRLSVFEGGATLGAVLAVCSDPNGMLDGLPVVDVLDTSVAASLISVERAGRHPRYLLLETVKAFAVDQLDEHEQNEARRRHAEYMIDFGRRMAVISEGLDSAEAFHSIQVEAANLRAAYQFFESANSHTKLAELVSAPGPLLWREACPIKELGSWLDLLLTYSDLEPTVRLAVLLIAAFRPDGPPFLARERANEALELATRLSDDAAIGFAEFVIGDLLVTEADTRLEATFQSAIARLEGIGHWRRAGYAVNSYAWLLLRERRFDEAQELLAPRLRSRELYGATAALMQYQQGRLRLSAGDIDGALAGIDLAMRIAERLELPLAMAFGWFGKGWAAQRKNDFGTARECFERSLVLGNQYGDWRDALVDRARLAVVCAKLGDLDAAREHALVVSELARKTPEPGEIGQAAHAHGVIALAEGDQKAARALMLEAVKAYAQTRLLDQMADMLEDVLQTLSAQAAEQLRSLPRDVREGRVSPAEVPALLNALRDI
ncbi:MAG: winged helix-turn-helix domain-containing protein [Actinomycetia bacterium]|nr:winged helix-turn-helix domain-containing protein [Actinomycetes bacterium]